MNASEPSLVVVIPTKDRRELLSRALGSVLSQTYRAFRIIVMNDGSTDDTQQYLEGLSDPRISVFHNDTNRGVNASRNVAIRTLKEGEWVVLLDDDDALLPDALSRIAAGVQEAPASFEVLFFNTTIATPQETFEGGYHFKEGEHCYDPNYFDVMTKAGLRGDCKPVISASLFGREYIFPEDINGFESEFFAILARDGIGIRYMRERAMRIDQAHGQERLSDTAAARDPASFVRANVRIFRDHAAFFGEYPREAMKRALGAVKVSLRAYDFPHAMLFSFYYLRSLTRLILGQGKKDE